MPLQALSHTSQRPLLLSTLSRRGHHIYNGAAWVNEGILHESEARTNICTYSNDFGNVAYLKWLPSNITVTPNSEVSPDGTTNATKFDMASNGYTRKITGHVPSVGQTYTFSVWIKAGTASEVKTALLFSGGGLGYTQLTHTLTNEWQRFTITSTLTSGTPDQVRARFVATQAGTIFVYGAQMEQGATPSSYIPTGSASVTRAAETLTVPAANLPWPTAVETTGTELVTNGTFDSDLSGWSTNRASWDNGTLQVNYQQYNTYSMQLLTGLVVGKPYQVGYTVTSDTQGGGGGALVGIFTSNSDYSSIALSPYVRGVSASYTFEFTATTPTAQLRLKKGGYTGVTNFGNISVKEVNPLALSIQMDGKMTYADTSRASEVTPY